MTKKPPTKRPIPIKIPRADAGSQPASRKMLSLVRNELKEDIGQVRVEVDQVRVEVAQLRAEVCFGFTQLRSEMESKFSEIKAMTHRTSLLVEEQNANNRIVLEGLQALWQRQDRLEGA